MKSVTISLLYTFVRITLFGECLCLEKSGNAYPVMQFHIPHERNSPITPLRKHQNWKGSSCLL